MNAKLPGKTGRPSSYSEKLAENLCEHIAMGKSLVSWCKKKGNPSYSAVMRWMDSAPGFREKYAQARVHQADYLADEIVEIADEAGGDVVFDKDGKPQFNGEFAARSRLRVDARKWYASKLAPKKYSDRTEITGADGGSINHSIEVTFVASKRSDS